MVCRIRRCWPTFLAFLKADAKTKAKGAYKCRCGSWHAIGDVDRITEIARSKGYGRFAKRVAA